ncbi:MAG: hypothetical protein FJZ43_00725 [Candidatus Staskawiczbacteria bacterium]|nr:hypothetical protein [Candidatus Staskawiczbacteria bacterium]
MDQFEAAPAGQWAIYVPKSLIRNKVWNVIKERCGGYSLYGDNLDQKISKRNDRDPANGSYAISVRAVVEADEENAGKSTNQLDGEGHRGMTFLERELLELAFFLTTGEHLDHENLTLCPASRDVDGRVPCMFWYPDFGKVQVHSCGVGSSGSHIRSRSVRVLPAKQRASVA